MKKLILLVTLATSSLMVFAQAELDVLRMAQTDIYGTARYMSMGGAFGALGGDVSAISINPAGIGIYRSSEFSISPAFQNSISKSSLGNNSISGSKDNSMINGFGYIGTFRTFDEASISNFNIGISFQKIADFNQVTKIQKNGNPSSFLDRIAMLENDNWGVGHTPFYEFANGAKVIGLNETQTGYVTPLLEGETTSNDLTINESGGINLWNFSLGMNMSHELYLGMALGVQTIKYDRNTTYLEFYEEGGGTELLNTLKTTGYGIDFKVGMIYKLLPELRVGLAYKTGSYYMLTDVFQASMASWGFINPSTDLPYNPNPTYIGADDYTDYLVQTPGKLTASAAYLFGSKGLISMDAEFLNYKKLNLLNSSGFEISEIKDYIDMDFRNTVNIRMGGEYRLSERFSTRVGLAWNPSPIVSDLEFVDIMTPNTRPEYSILRDTWTASIGMGYRTSNFFMDVALQNKMSYEHVFSYYYYNPNNVNNPSDDVFNDYSSLLRNKYNLALTCGLKF